MRDHQEAGVDRKRLVRWNEIDSAMVLAGGRSDEVFQRALGGPEVA